ncbi:mitochondrial ribosomal protein subunit L20-domain-containing protein [Emericellopsis atlantica]|uniref:Mitochondrial ribosomal protein subunit L20-domain-containing protein n=1 Tax=Emericellopsis atlantica TaxID=2614577 RepID=A0A9P7ZQA6_9HYPO|nr:mitochondrial ribosomal protein subunit L20-domain-containing protein [Emericellopsis atlantica]KAG9255740.1 mitochondrial ribosomal protein subunit L20-domain-containing protein [Emericellopsis atlantica]
MDMRALARPAAELLLKRTPVSIPLITTRSHKTTARTKRSLKIAPHDSFLPSRDGNASQGDHIIYNPPSSEASPFHTPFIFLPPEDPRRQAITRMRAMKGSAQGLVGLGGQTTEKLPPLMNKNEGKKARYHLTPAHMEEMRKLRAEDPLTWTVTALARKFDCSTIIVRTVAPPPKGHLEWLKAKEERRIARYGPAKLKAKAERKMRTEMMYRGEI